MQSLPVIDNVLSVASIGIDRAESDMIISVQTTTFEAGSDGVGGLVFTLAGDGAICLSGEAIEMTLTDLTRPYKATLHSA